MPRICDYAKQFINLTLKVINVGNIKLLDCTLRDGGRILDCAFSYNEIKQITEKLTLARLDIVEVGFLRDRAKVRYTGNSTFFTDVEQITPFIPQRNKSTKYVAFIDYGMFDFTTLKPRTESTIDGLRIGFTKSDYDCEYEGLISVLKSAKDKGYDVYVQGVNSLNYSDAELLKIVDMINEINPVSFGIVDTYGAMYVDDVSRIYGLVDNNLNNDIAIDFHSHNNFQLSFSFAQEIIRLSRGVRQIIIDATLNGMGKESGNLCTELITDFLVRKMSYDYDIDLIFDTIDENIYDYREKYHWGYSPNTLMAGIFKSHPNNVIYLTEKFRLDTKDIKNILARLEIGERQHYDYAKLDALTAEYSDFMYDDSKEIKILTELFQGRTVLALAPGNTLVTHRNSIDSYIAEKKPVIINVNFISDYPESYSFFANSKRYKAQSQRMKFILTSNIEKNTQNGIIVNYNNLVSNGYKLFDNSTIMLLNLLKRVNVRNIAIAGMDGFSSGSENNYYDDSLNVERLSSRLTSINEEIAEALEHFLTQVKGKCSISLITPSKFKDLVERQV